MDEKAAEREGLALIDEEHESLVLSDAGAVVKQTKGAPRGRWVDSPPIPYVSTKFP